MHFHQPRSNCFGEASRGRATRAAVAALSPKRLFGGWAFLSVLLPQQQCANFYLRQSQQVNGSQIVSRRWRGSCGTILSPGKFLQKLSQRGGGVVWIRLLRNFFDFRSPPLTPQVYRAIALLFGQRWATCHSSAGMRWLYYPRRDRGEERFLQSCDCPFQTMQWTLPTCESWAGSWNFFS